jgi:hypothetical protein
MYGRRILPLIAILAAALPGCAQEPIDAALNAKIRTEALEHSQVMATLHPLTDIFSPRLTASPTYKAAADWAVQRLAAWGLKDAHLETWDFGHPGWANEHCAAHVEAPYRSHLQVEVVSWTPSTQGIARGAAYLLKLPEEPTQAELTAFLEGARKAVRGRIVLAGASKDTPVLNANPYPARQTEEALAKRFDPAAPAAAMGPGRTPPPRRAGALEPRDINAQVDAFLVSARALVRVNDAALRNGQIRAFQNRAYDVSKALPTVVMRHEDYGRMARVLEDGKEVDLAFEIQNRDYPGMKGYNVVGEIPGASKPKEVILLGAHLDSWHTATGATDNGASAAVMMEVGRILQAVGAHPARTIRIVLWDGEEHGLLGAKAYVESHYGSAEAPKGEFGQVVAYFNMDAGAGQIRGLSMFGPAAGAQVLRELVAPFQDLAVKGASFSRNRPGKGLTGPSTDLAAFSAAGLPAVNVVQDGLEYFEYTWHTNIDTLDRVPEQDVKRTAAVLASVAYHLAQRTERLPFFAPADLPPVPPESH